MKPFTRYVCLGLVPKNRMYIEQPEWKTYVHHVKCYILLSLQILHSTKTLTKHLKYPRSDDVLKTACPILITHILKIVCMDLFSMSQRSIKYKGSMWNSLPKEIESISFTLSFVDKFSKKAVLLQRWPRDAPYIWMPWKFLTCTQNLKCVALAVPEIIPPTKTPVAIMIIATGVLVGGCEP